jgi:hypothetical protein
VKSLSALFSLADKISKVKINSHIAAYKKNMFANWAEMPKYSVTSATIVRKRRCFALCRRSKSRNFQRAVVNFENLETIQNEN